LKLLEQDYLICDHPATLIAQNKNKLEEPSPDSSEEERPAPPPLRIFASDAEQTELDKVIIRAQKL